MASTASTASTFDTFYYQALDLNYTSTVTPYGAATPNIDFPHASLTATLPKSIFRQLQVYEQDFADGADELTDTAAAKTWFVGRMVEVLNREIGEAMPGTGETVTTYKQIVAAIFSNGHQHLPAGSNDRTDIENYINTHGLGDHTNYIGKACRDVFETSDSNGETSNLLNVNIVGDLFNKVEQDGGANALGNCITVGTDSNNPRTLTFALETQSYDSDTGANTSTAISFENADTVSFWLKLHIDASGTPNGGGDIVNYPLYQNEYDNKDYFIRVTLTLSGADDVSTDMDFVHNANGLTYNQYFTLAEYFENVGQLGDDALTTAVASGSLELLAEK